MPQLTILVVFNIFLLLNLYSRVRKLEEEAKKNQSPSPLPPASTLPPTQISSPITPPSTIIKPTSQVFSDQLIAWLKEEWLIKLGALLLLIGFGWLTTYAFLNNWIGPTGRILLGIFAGITFLVIGWWRIKKYLHQGSIFLVLGSTTILMSVFAGRQLYDLFTPASALIIMFLSTTLVALASVKYQHRLLALASLILAAIAPLLTGSSTSDYVGLFSYLLIVIIGTIWLVVATGARELTLASQIILWIYSIPILSELKSTNQDTLLLFVFVFTALFFITNISGILKLKDKDIIPDLISAGSTGLFLLVWIIAVAPDHWQSLIISAWMIVFASGAYLSFTLTHKREPFYVYAGVSILMLGVATALELAPPMLTIAFTIEALIITLVVLLIMKNAKLAHQTTVLFSVPLLLSFESIDSTTWLYGILHLDFVAILLLGLTLLTLGFVFLPYTKEFKDQNHRIINRLLLIVGSVMIYILLWLSLHTLLLSSSIATMLCLIIYTLIGLTTHFIGIAQENRILQLYGNVLIGVVVIRLLLIDIWDMELTGRIITFFLIGVMLVSTAFIDKKRLIPQSITSVTS
jgi:uncharacterized membrane protein